MFMWNYVLHNYECDNVIIQVYYLPTAVISEPDDVTVCEGRSCQNNITSHVKQENLYRWKISFTIDELWRLS